MVSSGANGIEPPAAVGAMVPSSRTSPSARPARPVGAELDRTSVHLALDAGRPVAGRQAPDVRAVASEPVRVVDGVGALGERGPARVLEVVDPPLAHVRVLDAAEVHPDMRVLVAEEGAEVEVLVAVVGRPAVRARERRPRLRPDRVRGRAEGEEVEDHRLVVALVAEVEEALLGLPPHANEARRELRPVPLDAAVERVGEGANFFFFRTIPVEILLAEEDASHQERRVDGGKLDLPEPLTSVHVEEVVEEAAVAGRALSGLALRRVPEKAERGERAASGLGSGDVAALDADGIGREREADGGHARERRLGPAVRREPVLRVRRVPEPAEGVLLKRVEERLVFGGRGRVRSRRRVLDRLGLRASREQC